jgi:hypothetical protein
MRDRVTFCIKTIHRPHCCATLVRSIYEHCGDDRPLIYVLDDGKPELRFSLTCPDEAAMVDRLIETEYDIGLSAGRKQYPKLRINIRKSHKGRMRQYYVIDGKPMPFNSNPDAAYRVCMQRTCTQLVNGCLAKCPALAYWPQLETKARLESISEWNLFRRYEACPPTASDDELRSFLETKSIPQCASCPSRRVAFRHPSPLQRSNLQ